MGHSSVCVSPHIHTITGGICLRLPPEEDRNPASFTGNPSINGFIKLLFDFAIKIGIILPNIGIQINQEKKVLLLPVLQRQRNKSFSIRLLASFGPTGAPQPEPRPSHPA